MKTSYAKYLDLTVLIIIAIACIGKATDSHARKKGYKLSTKAKQKTEAKATVAYGDTVSDAEMVAGSFMVASQCESCNNGYRLNQVIFTGFDKNQSSSKESFFIINNTDRELTGVTLYIDYRTPDGRQLHKQFLKLSCSIPPGETRKADIPSWDTQRSFYYHKSQPSRKGGNPFTVRFDPIAYYLRF